MNPAELITNTLKDASSPEAIAAAEKNLATYLTPEQYARYQELQQAIAQQKASGNPHVAYEGLEKELSGLWNVAQTAKTQADKSGANAPQISASQVAAEQRAGDIKDIRSFEPVKVDRLPYSVIRERALEKLEADKQMVLEMAKNDPSVQKLLELSEGKGPAAEAAKAALRSGLDQANSQAMSQAASARGGAGASALAMRSAITAGAKNAMQAANQSAALMAEMSMQGIQGLAKQRAENLATMTDFANLGQGTYRQAMGDEAGFATTDASNANDIAKAKWTAIENAHRGGEAAVQGESSAAAGNPALVPNTTGLPEQTRVGGGLVGMSEGAARDAIAIWPKDEEPQGSTQIHYPDMPSHPGGFNNNFDTSGAVEVPAQTVPANTDTSANAGGVYQNTQSQRLPTFTMTDYSTSGPRTMTAAPMPPRPNSPSPAPAAAAPAAPAPQAPAPKPSAPAGVVSAADRRSLKTDKSWMY